MFEINQLYKVQCNKNIAKAYLSKQNAAQEQKFDHFNEEMK